MASIGAELALNPAFGYTWKRRWLALAGDVNGSGGAEYFTVIIITSHTHIQYRVMMFLTYLPICSLNPKINRLNANSAYSLTT